MGLSLNKLCDDEVLMKYQAIESRMKTRLEESYLSLLAMTKYRQNNAYAAILSGDFIATIDFEGWLEEV